MELKPKLQRQHYFETLRRMTPEQRLDKAMELSELGKRLFLYGLRRRFPEADETTIHAPFLKRLAKCHNLNYSEKWRLNVDVGRASVHCAAWMRRAEARPTSVP